MQNENSLSGYRSFYNALPVGLCRTSLDGSFLFANPACAKILGFNSVDDLCLYNVNLFYESNTREELIKKIEENGNVVKDHEIPVRKIDGSLMWIKATMCLRKDKGYIESCIEDITEQKLAQDKVVDFQKKELISLKMLNNSFKNKLNSY